MTPKDCTEGKACSKVCILSQPEKKPSQQMEQTLQQKCLVATYVPYKKMLILCDQAGFSERSMYVPFKNICFSSNELSCTRYIQITFKGGAPTVLIFYISTVD